jgi:hypothetical protein
MGENDDRVSAARDEGFGVFLVGMRIDRLRAVREGLPVAAAAPRMVREQAPAGLLGSRYLRDGWQGPTIVQYWASFEALERYVAAPGTEHRRRWQRFDARAAESDAIGIWHETSLVESYETAYRHVPPHGLGAAGSELVPADAERETAAGRLGRDPDGAPDGEVSG